VIPIRLLNGSTLHINAELLESVSAAPDTIITLTSGRRIVASTRPEEILEAVVAYRRRIHQCPGDPTAAGREQTEGAQPARERS
jgi:flagellar protein FlbD